jgi:hypothetical protein
MLNEGDKINIRLADGEKNAKIIGTEIKVKWFIKCKKWN